MDGVFLVNLGHLPREIVASRKQGSKFDMERGSWLIIENQARPNGRDMDSISTAPMLSVRPSSEVIFVDS